MPQPADTVQADVTYYNYSKNKLVLDTSNIFKFVYSPESLDPQFPATPEKSLEVYRISLNPYTLNGDDLVSKQIEHKHYTMADIGLLEKKLNKLEETTTLSLLELDTANIAVLDSDGNNRTKSGFFVDNFVDHFFSDLSDPDYKAALDPAKKALRPRNITEAINLEYDSDLSANVIKKGDNIYLNHGHKVYINQSVASVDESLNPLFHKKYEGNILLSPASDNWVSQEYVPQNTISNGSVLNATNVQQLWDDHSWNWGGTPIDQLSVGSQTNDVVLNSTTTTSTSSSRSGRTTSTFENWTTDTTFTSMFITGETTVTEVIGDRLLQTASIPFMRSRKVYFKGQGFRPDTKLYAFFDDIEVTDWCRSETFVRTSDDAETVGNVNNAALGHPEGSTDLIADANGTIEGSFFIPSTANFRFATGSKLFQLIDITNTDTEKGTSFGSQIYTAAGILQTRQRDVLSTRVLEVDFHRPTTETTSGSNLVGVVTDPPAPPPPAIPPSIPAPARPVPPRVVVERSCFVAGTMVTMADGSHKKIEEVELGEKLLGQDGAINTVLEFDHPQLAGRDIIGINGLGKFMTPEHPMYTKNGWRSYSASTFERQFPDMLWLDVKDLQIGDEILKEDGTWLEVTSLEVYSGEPEQTVYNFILDGNNTYYANSLLAHNRGGGNDPLAQSFTITQPNGVFVTKIELYFSAKHDTLPMWIQLRPMADGSPAYDVIPGSVIYKYPSEVTTSTDASVATVFEFDEPIYLSPSKEYALVAIANTPEYRIWTSRVGDFVLGTTDQKITQQPFLGSLFKSQNSKTWTPTQWEDMKFKVHTAQFTTNSGTASLVNTDVPQKLLSEDPFTVDSGDATLTVYQPAHGFTVGDTVNISGATTFAGINAGSINGARTIISRDADGYTFEADSDATSTEIGGGSVVLADQNILMDVANVNLAKMLPSGTDIQSYAITTTGQSVAGSETAYQRATEYKQVDLGKNITFNNPQMIANAANETTYLSGQKSFQLDIAMRTVDENVSPIIDMQRATVIAVSNQIDKQASSPSAGFNVPLNYVSETNPTGGSHSSKHITKVTTLAQDAVGLKVFLSAHKPNAASFEVYYRVSNGDEFIFENNWVLVNSETALISDEDPNTFREYTYLVGGPTGALDAFNQMQLKVVMQSENSSKTPVFRDLRAIALSV